MCTTRPTESSDMGRPFLALILYLLFCNKMALCCLPREYAYNGVCCPMCDKGLFVKTHCTVSSSVCVVCADSTYMDHPNGLTECFRCKECDVGGNLIVKQKCTTTSNTVCECKAGHFCESQDCDMCQEHSLCPAGQYVKKNGTGLSDRVCEKCPSGHFTNTSNSDNCIPWQKCSELGFVQSKEGTLTTDSICEEKRRHGFILLSFLCPVIVAVLAFKHLFKSLKEKKKPNVYGDQTSPPVQEQGTGIRV